MKSPKNELNYQSRIAQHGASADAKSRAAELVRQVTTFEEDKCKNLKLHLKGNLVPMKMWVYDPQSGGKSIPKAMQPKIRQRILDHAEKHYSDRYNRIDIRFRGKFCYIDAYSEPFVPPDYNSELIDGKSREERIAQLRDVPTHLCRLRYFGDEENWTMAFYTYSHMKYEPCIFDNGSWHGTPEEAFDTSAVYLMK